MTFHNRTRVSRSIPQRLRAEGRWYLIPLYWLLMTSDLAAEAVRGSGSWRFADHIYRRRPRGRLGIGLVLDLILLHTAAARAFRRRYLFSKRVVIARLQELQDGKPSTVMSVPSGIPRDLIEVAAEADVSIRARYVALDLDPEALAAARAEAMRRGVGARFEFICSDALNPAAYPVGLDVVVSTGFGEFLDDGQLGRFLTICYRALAPGGIMFISATSRHRVSAFLLEAAELRAWYRSSRELEDALSGAGFDTVEVSVDRTGLQSFAIARKAPP